MSCRWWLCLPLWLCVASAGAHGVATRPWAVEDLPVVHRLQAPASPPPLPDGTAALRFEQFFHLPVGPRGLEPTPLLLGLHRSRVRLFGYMVKHDSPYAGEFLLAAFPSSLAEQADGAADDLPPALVTVHMPPALAKRLVPFVPGILMVEGVLDVGGRDEADGRRSMVRLQLDWPSVAGVLK